MNTMTIGALLEDAELQFEQAQLSYGHGTDNAFDDACVLLRYALNMPYDTNLIEEHWFECISSESYERFKTLLSRRINERIPTPYLTGVAYVQGVELLTHPSVIVPRSLLGEWLLSDNAFDWLNDTEPKFILDVCTGSGAIAIQAGLYYPNARIDALDIDTTAIDLAYKNTVKHGLSDRVKVYQGDLYEALPNVTLYDLILSNPPYVNENAMQTLPLEYQAEPRLALAGGLDGMDIVRKLIINARQYLSQQGVLVIEIGHEADYFETAFPNLEFSYVPVTAGDDLIVLMTYQQLKQAGY